MSCLVAQERRSVHPAAPHCVAGVEGVRFPGLNEDVFILVQAVAKVRTLYFQARALLQGGGGDALRRMLQNGD